MNINMSGLEARMDIMQKRAAIESVLSGYFTARQLPHIMGHWEAKYSRQPAYVLQRFLAEICTTDELKMSRSIILQALVKELNRGNTEKNNAHEEQATDLNTMTALNTLTALQQCFEKFLAILLTTAKGSYADSYAVLRSRLLSQLTEALSLSEQFILSWLTTLEANAASPQLVTTLHDKDLPHVVSLVYSALCDGCGPLEADNIFASAIARCRAAGYQAEIARLI